MANIDFIGREYELSLLAGLLRKKTSSLVVVKGRRRLGKSRLIAEFAAGHTFYSFQGLPPNKQKTTAQSQRDHFAALLAKQTGLPEIETDNWSKLFSLLHERTKKGRVIVLLDEITWIADNDPLFLSKLQWAWENEFKHNPKLIFILCGSISAWIENNILSSTGFFGRVSLKLTLNELPLQHCNVLLKKLGFKGSGYERFMLLGVMGGVPWYLENIDPGLLAIENIKQLCFRQDGLLVKEYQEISHDIFGKKHREIPEKIITHLAQGSADYDQIVQAIDYHSGGPLSNYLNELEQSGFVQRDFTWQLTSNKTSSLSKFRLKDNYLRFYLKFIAPKLSQIEQQQYLQTDVTTLPGWETTLGLQFENLVLNNRAFIHEILNIESNHIVHCNPYFQRATKKQAGCQIDYLIQTKFKTLYVCEIKFSINEINSDVITAVQEKIKRINVPKGYTCLPVLISVGTVSERVHLSDYFIKIIELQNLMDV